MSTAPSHQDPNSMAPPAQKHEHEYKQEHENEHHHAGVPLNQEDEEEVLLARIRAQVDFYFSPPNLAQDHFLCSLLTSHEHYGAVPVQQICGFPKIRQLVAMHANMMSADLDKAQLPPADPELLYRAVAHKSDWVRVVGDAATGYWFVPFSLPDQHTNQQSWYTMSSQEQHQQQQAYPNRSPPPHEQQQQQHARMVSGPPPPPPPSPPKKGQTSPTATAMTSSSTTESMSSSTSESAWPGTYQHAQQQQHVQQHVQHPVVKERTVVLVHDIPDAHAEQDLWQLFSGRSRLDDKSSSVSDDIANEYPITTFQPKSVVQDVGRTWHVTFGTEQEATAALLASRDKMYRDMPIRAGLKNDITNPNHSVAYNNNKYGIQYSYQQQQQLQPYWQHTTPGNGQGESHYYMPVLPPMPYGTVQHQHAQHQHQQYSYGYAVMPPIIMSPPVMVPGMYATAGPSHQIGYAVPADYANNSHYQYAGAVPAAPAPPSLPATSPPPPQQVFVRSSQPSSNEEGDAAAAVVVDDQEESTAQAKSSSQDTATTATVNGGGPQKNNSWAKKWPNNNSNNKGGHKYQRNGSNQSWSGDSQKEGDGQHPRQQYKGKMERTNGHKSKKNRGKQQRGNAEASGNLTDEHFPALGGSSKKKTHHVNSKPKKVAYAEALLKPPTLTSVPSGERTGQTRTNTKQDNVERQMKELCLSEQGPSQQSSEQKAASS